MEPNVALEWITRQDWLEPVEEQLQHGIQGAFAGDSAIGKPVENALHGVWLGHALHPVLTDVPIGAWTVAFILDIAEEMDGKRRYRGGADASVSVGLAGAAAAALAGLTDWKDLQGEQRRTGLVHGLLNVAATTLYAASAWQRSRGRRGSGRALAYAGFGLVMASAWLGGHLVYEDRVGVNHAPPPEPDSEFVSLLPLTALEEGRPCAVQHQDQRILLLRRGDKVFAIGETCSHLGGPLAEGAIEGNCVRCPWHGSLFSLADGSVVESPAVYPQPVYEARIQDGQVQVRPAQKVRPARKS